MGVLEWLLRGRKKQGDRKLDWVIFYATQPDNLGQRTADFTNALRNLSVLKEESLERFRSNVST